MTRSPRRIYLYWLLLLVPTLAVGTGAILLLRREQARLETDTAAARDTRRDAVVGRTQLVAENMDLLAGDVRDALISALRESAAADTTDFLARWPQDNPLVRAGFLLTAGGQLRFPDPTGGEGRTWQQRFTTLLTELRPWRDEPPVATASAPAPSGRTLAQDSQQAQGQLPPPPGQPLTLTSQFSGQQVGISRANNLTGANTLNGGLNVLTDVGTLQNAGLGQNVGLTGTNTVTVNSNAGRNLIVNGSNSGSGNDRNSYANTTNADQYQSARKDLQISAKNGTVAQQAAAVERSGWVPLDDGGAGPLAAVVWLQRNHGDSVRGAEINLAELTARLATVLPAEFEAGDGYALLDAAGRVLGARGDAPDGAEPAVRVPLDAALLPGWQVAAFVPGLGAGSAGRPLFVMGSLLIGIFVAVILASGSMLLWQAQTSATEARQKTSFVANVSHEFKTPLTTIRLYAELLEQGRVRDTAQRTDYLRIIGSETQRLARLVNNVLDFSKLEQGQKKYAREPFDLRSELAALLDAHAPRIAAAGLRLVRDLTAGPLPLTTDRDAFAQIVLNLVENACKYAAAGGELTVVLTALADGGAEARVLDRGPGVPTAHRERIFEQFHRVDAALTAEKTGAGLGLSIARQLARGLGGNLRHEPRAGGGACFIFSLP